MVAGDRVAVPERADVGRAGSRPYGSVPGSGEINSLAFAVEAIARVEQHFAIHALDIDHTDGISMSFPQWRFNLRSSNTEPVVRLNVESRGDVR